MTKKQFHKVMNKLFDSEGTVAIICIEKSKTGLVARGILANPMYRDKINQLLDNAFERVKK